jgi:hypothetical protein
MATGEYSRSPGRPGSARRRSTAVTSWNTSGPVRYPSLPSHTIPQARPRRCSRFLSTSHPVTPPTSRSRSH